MHTLHTCTGLVVMEWDWEIRLCVFACFWKWHLLLICLLQLLWTRLYFGFSTVASKCLVPSQNRPFCPILSHLHTHIASFWIRGFLHNIIVLNGIVLFIFYRSYITFIKLLHFLAWNSYITIFVKAWNGVLYTWVYYISKSKKLYK